MSKLPSARFATIYESLPADAQQALVEKHLIPLLNLVEKSRTKKVLSSATQLEKRHAGLPVLDLKAKKNEISALLEELHKDAKRSFVKERSNKSELLNEAVASLTNWLNDIWSVVYEHNVSFMHAHKCLLFVAGTLEHISSGRSGCKCAFTNMYVSVTLKRRSGKRVKTFDINGAHNLAEVLYYIWRDLFLSLLSTGSSRQISMIPEMLDDIKDLMGWNSLERMLYGGRKCPHDYDDEDDEEDEDEDDYFDDNESDYEDSEVWKDSAYTQPYYANHWSERLSSQMWLLRRHIQTALTAAFKLAPSLRLYTALLAISPDTAFTQAQLQKYLETIATSCPEAFAAALDIHALEENTEALVALLNTHTHLLRPRDAASLQAAVTTIARTPSLHARALQCIEKELLETAHAIRAALLVSFSQLDTPANRAELAMILKLRPGAAGRQDRIETWADAVSTPGTNAPNPMAFAAMMMGLPLVPGMDPSEDADPLGYLDLDPHDPDLEDMREEFRPRIKQRFESWSDVAIVVQGGDLIQQKVYREIIESMPFLRANDVVEEIVNRIADKPSKHHVCDGVDALLAFVKVQRRRVASQKSDVKRRKETPKTTRTTGTSGAAGTAGTTSASGPAGTTSTAGSSTGTTQPTTSTPIVHEGFPYSVDALISSAGSSRLGSGGMEDVD
ncbi:hypothetical protein B0H21DRAFT_157497 [Amylocystis lapponica]|nr:hypothetical protein B0H21DRAFT_157497 [Amylocystis lapponica]